GEFLLLVDGRLREDVGLALGVAEGELGVGLRHLDAGKDPAVLHLDGPVLVGRKDRAAGLEERTDEVAAREAAADPGEVGADPRALRADPVALHTARLLGILENLAAALDAPARERRLHEPL